MSQFKIKMLGIDSISDYLDIGVIEKEDSRMELRNVSWATMRMVVPSSEVVNIGERANFCGRKLIKGSEKHYKV